MSDLLRTLAFAFRRKGATSLPGTDLRLLLAYDLRWFAPEDAKRVVQRAVDLGLLRDESGALQPTFDVARVDVPLNFRPGVQVLDEEAPRPIAAAPAPPAPTLVAAVAPSETEKAADDERRKRGLLMGSEVARLVVRRRAGDDVTVEAAALEASILGAAARSRA